MTNVIHVINVCHVIKMWLKCLYYVVYFFLLKNKND